MSVESPQRIWIEADDECPYFYEAHELHDVEQDVIEYVRSDLVASLSAENERLKQEIAATQEKLIRANDELIQRNSKALSRTGGVKPLDEDDYEEIISAAAINMRKATSGIRGQMITVQDSLDWWLMKETEQRILAALETAETERLRAERVWQPIETAPKDGTKVDLWVVDPLGEGRRVPDCSWGWGQWIGSKGLAAERLGHKATHWIYRPTPPQE